MLHQSIAEPFYIGMLPPGLVHEDVRQLVSSRGALSFVDRRRPTSNLLARVRSRPL
jgi:hypothetical protein